MCRSDLKEKARPCLFQTILTITINDQILLAVAINELLCMDFIKNEDLAPIAVEKIKIFGAVLELPAKQHCQFNPFGPFLWSIGSAV